MPLSDHSKPQLQAAALPPSTGRACIGVAASLSCEDQAVIGLGLCAQRVEGLAHVWCFAQANIITQDVPCMRQGSQ